MKKSFGMTGSERVEDQTTSLSTVILPTVQTVKNALEDFRKYVDGVIVNRTQCQANNTTKSTRSKKNVVCLTKADVIYYSTYHFSGSYRSLRLVIPFS
nr:hypothetical transcript [Hymenolepis microstoma]